MIYPKGHEFEFKTLRPSIIRFDELYQRDLDLARAHKIANDFDGDIFNEPKISFRDGQFWCFDGMHSIYGWKFYHNNEDIPVNCKVYRGMTQLDEINCFVKQTGHKKDLQIGDKLKALEAARDPDVLKMKRAIEQYGFTVNFGKRINTPIAVNCYGQALRTYKSLPYDENNLVWKTISDLWWKQPDSTSAKIVKGITEFYQLYHDEINYETLIAKLKNTSVNTLLQDADMYGDKKGKYKYQHPYAFAIVVKYNNYLRRNALNENKAT